MFKYMKLLTAVVRQITRTDFHVKKSSVLQLKTHFVIQLYCNFLTCQKLASLLQILNTPLLPTYLPVPKGFEVLEKKLICSLFLPIRLPPGPSDSLDTPCITDCRSKNHLKTFR